MMDTEDVTGVILAGGRGSRMNGQDKGLVPYRGRPLIEHVLAAIAPQVGAMMISANRNLPRYRSYGFPVVHDVLENFQGPLAGLLTAMQQVETPFLLLAPCDAPLLPENLLEKLYGALQQSHSRLALAHDGEQLQPLFALLETNLQEDLQRFLDAGERKLRYWCSLQQPAIADFSSQAECFRNFNSAAELAF